jgi:hypothetical protein
MMTDEEFRDFCLRRVRFVIWHRRTSPVLHIMLSYKDQQLMEEIRERFGVPNPLYKSKTDPSYNLVVRPPRVPAVLDILDGLIPERKNELEAARRLSDHVQEFGGGILSGDIEKRRVVLAVAVDRAVLAWSQSGTVWVKQSRGPRKGAYGPGRTG